MSKILYYGSRVAALGAAAAAGWWGGAGTARPKEGVGLQEGLFNVVFGKVSASALQGYSVQAPVELPQIEPGVPRVTQVGGLFTCKAVRLG